MSSRLKLDVRNLSLGRRHLVNAYEVKAGIPSTLVLFSYVVFALYVNDIIMKLENSKLGCYVGDTYTGCIMYADNIVLIAAS